MTNKKIKLNLGCGFVYKPGYINIDKFDNAAADKICDISCLPFKSNSVNILESSQLIEHFDCVHCKYVLSEWFRVLEPYGTLILETPDLEKSFRKFVAADLETQKTTLRWIYGIDSVGMQHRTGFTFDLLRGLLEEIGFENISREEPKTHRYEPGMRVLCKKPKDCLTNQLFACFRKRLKNELKTDDSYILIPLEAWLEKVFDSYEEFKKNKEGCINKIISKTVVCTPCISLIFLEECVNFGIIKKSEMEDKLGLLNYLAEIEFHKKVFSLWTKSKKNVGKVEGEFRNFTSRLESLMLDILNDRANYGERLKYIAGLEPAEIKVFDFYLVFLEAEKLFNGGIKCFHERRFSRALNFFSNSSKINPDNPLVYWNMARLGCILKFEEHEITKNYEQALNLMKNRKEIETELNCVKNGKINLIPKEPLWKI